MTGDSRGLLSRPAELGAAGLPAGACEDRPLPRTRLESCHITSSPRDREEPQRRGDNQRFFLHRLPKGY